MHVERGLVTLKYQNERSSLNLCTVSFIIEQSNYWKSIYYLNGIVANALNIVVVYLSLKW